MDQLQPKNFSPNHLSRALRLIYRLEKLFHQIEFRGKLQFSFLTENNAT